MWESAVCVQPVRDEMWEAECHSSRMNTDFPTNGWKKLQHMMQPPTGLMQPGAGLMLQCAGLMQPCEAPPWGHQPAPGVEKSDATPTCGEYKYTRQWRP